MTLHLVAHNAGRAGGGASLDVYAMGARGLAGWEITATVDPRRATLAGADSTSAQVPASQFLDSSISDQERSSVLAAYSPSGQTLSGNIKLGTFYLDGVSAGAAQVALSSVRLVGRDGRSLAGALGGSSTSVSAPASGSRTPAKATTRPGGAPRAPYALPATATASEKKAANPDLPLQWQTLRLSGQPCAPSAEALDRNGDGCLDIGDLVLNGEASKTAAPTVQLPAGAKPAAAGASATPAAAGTTFVVNTTTDEFDQNVGNGICKTASGVCSLRAAIQEADAASGSNTIAFAIPGTGVHTIQLTRSLPGLNDASGGTLIDGYTQAGSAPNTNPVSDDAQLMIEIRGNGATGDGTTSGFDALPITSAFNEIRGLSMFNARRELWINGSSATSNKVVGNFIGTNAAGTFETSAIQLEAIGIKIEQDAARTWIGTSDTTKNPTPADRNVISGNGRQGIGLWHNSTDFSVIVNNIVGLSPDGTRALPNRKHGIDLNFGVSNTQIGGTRPGERNVSSGNDDDGVEVSHTTLTAQNSIVGNYIGSDLSGNAAPAYATNLDVGVFIEDASTANVVSQNVIVNNARGGVVTTTNGTNGTTTQNVISNNRIGVGINGAALANGLFGVDLDGSGNTVGPGNLIENNTGPGVEVTQTNSIHNKITKNTIVGNTGLSIDLSPVGSSNPNDPGDADAGANDGQNFPDTLTTSPGVIAGTTCAGCTVEVYTTGTPNGSGPARSYQGSATANSSGNFSFPNSLPVGTAISAVTIAANGDTSEMAPNVTVVAAGNGAPAINAGSDVTVDPGTTSQLLATVTDPQGTSDKVTWDLDGNGTFETAGNPVTFHAPVNGPATITVTAKATDPGGLTATNSLVVTVRSSAGNSPPIGRMQVPSQVVVGDPIPITIDNPSSSGLTYAFNCGSGFGAASSNPSKTCASGNGPTATVQARLTDPSSGLTTTYNALVLVHPNLLTNGNVDAGTTSPSGWTFGAQKNWVTSPVVSGTHAVASLGTGTSTNATLSQTFAALQNTSYQLSAYVDVPASGSGSVSLLGRWLDANGNIQATQTVGVVSSPTGGYTRITASFPRRNAASSLRVDVVWNTTNRAIAVDNIDLVRDNQVLNGEFDLDANGDGKPDSWAIQSRFTRDSQVSHLTAFSGLATGDGGAFTAAQRVGNIIPGKTYVVTGWINAPKTNSTYFINTQVRWTDSQFGLLRLDKIKTFGDGNSPFGTPGWQQFSAQLTPPAGATLANVEIFFSTGFTGTDHVDSVVMGLS